MLELNFDAISSDLIISLGTGGQRDYEIDLTGNLETAEVATAVAVTCSDSSALTFTNVTVGSDDKSVNFRVTVTANTIARLVVIYVAFEGDSGSGDTYHCNQPIVSTLPI